MKEKRLNNVYTLCLMYNLFRYCGIARQSMIQWRSPSEEETTIFLSQLKKETLIDGVYMVLGIVFVLHVFLFLIYACIYAIKEGKLRSATDYGWILGILVFVAVFIFGVIYSIIEACMTLGKYRRGEIEVTSGILKDKWKKIYHRNFRYFVIVEMEDGSIIKQEVKGGLYKKVSCQTPVNVVRVKSDAFMWKDEYGIYKVE